MDEIKCIIDEILLIIYMDKNNIIISINRKMTIKKWPSNNRIIIKESFAGVTHVGAYHRPSDGHFFQHAMNVL